MNTKPRIKTVLLSLAALLVALICVVIGAMIIQHVTHGANTSMKRISASTVAFTDLSDTNETSIGALQEGQRIIYALDLEQGDVELWIENEAGDRMTERKGVEGTEVDCPENGEYFLVTEGRDATFNVSVSIYEAP